MSLPPTFANPGEMLFRQSLLSLAPRDVTIQDQLDRAEWLNAAGHARSARLLFGVAALRLGVTGESLRWLAAPAERLGYRLRRPAAAGPSPAAAPAFAVDLATAELARILPLLAGRRSFASRPASSDETCAVAGLQDGAAADIRLDAFFARTGPALAALLGGAGEPHHAGFAALAAEAAAGLAPIDVGRHAGAGIDRLAKIAAFNELQGFLLIDGGIADPPFGSPELFDAAAGLAPIGLGAYFSNVERLVRDVDDLFALIRLASRDAAVDADVGSWCVLLSTRFSPDAARHLATALLQRGLLDALRGMIARVDGRAALALDREFLWHLRDLSLLHDQVEIARDCQAVLARRAANTIEWCILGDICAVTGDMAGVEASLSRALAISPGNHDAEARLSALRAGTVDYYARTRGFFGAPERAHLRFAVRAAFG